MRKVIANMLLGFKLINLFDEIEKDTGITYEKFRVLKENEE